jgi:tetrathionate reductase subunit B
MNGKNFLVDADKCTGCKLCIIACKDEHVGMAYMPWTKPQPDTGHFWINVLSIERGSMPRVRMSYLPLLCQHCENAPCMKACPENAIKRRSDGLVWIDPVGCNGCNLCQEACPYGVIYMNDELGIAQKCTGCAHRVDAGTLPRCAEVCPHDAIMFTKEVSSAIDNSEDNRPIEIYHPEYQTEPRVYWKGLPKPWIAGTLIDEAKDEVISGAAVTATDLINDASVTVASDEFGDFWIMRMKEDRKYRLAIRKDGYQNFQAIVTTNGDQDMGDISLKQT